jgi:5-methylcytosine-specific restriction protein A
MPHKVRVGCRYPGCKELIKEGLYCARHSKQNELSKRDLERQRLYDRHWQVRRKMHLAAHPWCEDCLAESIYEPATEVHHEERHQGNRMIFINSKLISLCKVCHSRRTIKETING